MLNITGITPEGENEGIFSIREVDHIEGAALAATWSITDCNSSKEAQVAEKASRRETIEPNPGDKRYVRRNEDGEFTEQDDVSRSLGQDVRRKAKHESEPGQGDRGDRKSS